MKSKGFSLLELMIVIILSAFIINSLSDWYISVKQHATENGTHSKLAQQQLLLSNVLQLTIQSAGYLGCSDWGKITVYDQRYHQLIPAALSVYDKNNKELSNTIKQKMKPDTRALTVRQLSNEVYDVNIIKSAWEVTLNESASSLNVGDVVILSDCDNAEINIISHIIKNHLSTTVSLRFAMRTIYKNGVLLGKYQDNTFYIANSHYSKSANYSLFISNASNSNEISEDLSDLKIEAAKTSHSQVLFQTVKGDIDLRCYDLLNIKLELAKKIKFHSLIYLRESAS